MVIGVVRVPFRSAHRTSRSRARPLPRPPAHGPPVHCVIPHTRTGGVQNSCAHGWSPRLGVGPAQGPGEPRTASRRPAARGGRPYGATGRATTRRRGHGAPFRLAATATVGPWPCDRPSDRGRATASRARQAAGRCPGPRRITPPAPPHRHRAITGPCDSPARRHGRVRGAAGGGAEAASERPAERRDAEVACPGRTGRRFSPRPRKSRRFRRPRGPRAECPCSARIPYARFPAGDARR